MARAEKQVVAKRGCTCCGTGCAIIGVAVPLVNFVLWDAFGIVATLMGGLLAVVATNAVRLVSGTHPYLGGSRHERALDERTPVDANSQ